MNNATQQIVSKAWNFAHVPRDDVGAAPYLYYPAAYNTGGENTAHTGGCMASYLLLPVIPPKS